MAKKIKRLEDKLKKSKNSNNSLKAHVKSLKKGQVPTHLCASGDDTGPRNHDDETGTGDSDSDSDIAHASDDPNLLFSSRRVHTLTFYHITQAVTDSSQQITIKSREDPDKLKRVRRSYQEEGSLRPNHTYLFNTKLP